MSSEQHRSDDPKAGADEVLNGDDQQDSPPMEADFGGDGGRSYSASLSGALLVGSRLGDYQILRRLGRGGMADVYAARHLSLGRDVAIKVLRSELARDRGYVERFRREARAAAKLNHPSIVQVYDVGSAGATYYIAQELIDGENLREYVSRVGSISAEEAVDVLIAVGYALEAAAEFGITHRDIKPENVMRSSKGSIKVADFGLARLGPEMTQGSTELTQAGLTLGTPRYMSPEQVQGRSVDVRSDLYSLGVTLYHLLAGRPPFEAEDPIALAVMHLHDTPQPIDRVRGKDDLPEWLIAVVARLMEKLPEDRYQTPSELLDAIHEQTGTTSGRVGRAQGTAAATVRLQRANEAAKLRRRRLAWRWSLASLIVLALTATAAAMALRQPAPSVDTLLASREVPRAESVQAQYLVGMSLDSPASWQAVGKYFPPSEKAINEDYHHKAMLQLARLHLENGRLRAAREQIRDLISRPGIDQLHRAVALVRLCEVAEASGNQEELMEAKRALVRAYNVLKAENPKAFRTFKSVVPLEQQMKFGLPDVDFSEST